MSLRSKIATKFSKAKTQGFLRTIEVEFNRFVPPWVFRYSKGDIFDLDAEKLKSLGQSGGGEGLVVKCLDADANHQERMKLREFTWNSVPLETTSNDLGYLIYDQDEPDQILGGVWAGLGSFSENNLGVDFHFDDHQVWLYCAFVHDAARGRGVYKKLISFVANDLQQRGFAQLLGIVQPWNKISRLMHEKQSRGICGRMSAVRILNFVWVNSSGNLEVDKRLVTRISSDPAQVKIGEVQLPAKQTSTRTSHKTSESYQSGQTRMPKPN